MPEAKLDMAIFGLENIDKKFEYGFNSIDKKFEDFNVKFKELNKKFTSKSNKHEKKCCKLEIELKTKATAQSIADLKKRISHLEQSQYAAKCQELASET